MILLDNFELRFPKSHEGLLISVTPNPKDTFRSQLLELAGDIHIHYQLYDSQWRNSLVSSAHRELVHLHFAAAVEGLFRSVVVSPAFSDQYEGKGNKDNGPTSFACKAEKYA